MRGKSHIALGQYLLRKYFPDLVPAKRRAFLLGCIEPDRNPVTYLKGSFRHQWLRGHNFLNARRFMSRISLRLQQKDIWGIWDYYTLGKLIHYTADAFTFAHNHSFSTSLAEHREYECNLQCYFLDYLQEDPQMDIRLANSVMDAVNAFHREYSRSETNIHRDSCFALQASCCVLAILLTPKLV